MSEVITQAELIDLLSRLEEMANFQNDDLSVAGEAKDMIISLVAQLHDQPTNRKASEEQVGGDHYLLPIQPVEYIVKNDIDFLSGNVIKYATRHREKGGAEDVRKIIHYARLILLHEYGIDE